MLFFYIRHGDPIYNPDSLTEKGHAQARALSARMKQYAPDRIFASTSTRAQQTAQPTCEALGLEMTLLDFANEGHAWNEFCIADPETGRGDWLFQLPHGRRLLANAELQAMGAQWYMHPSVSHTGVAGGVARVRRESDAFFASLGYEHIEGTGSYRVVHDSHEKVALFAHQGFGMIFLSTLLDIPYPFFALHCDLFHTGVAAIEFRNQNGIAIPKLWSISSDLHLDRAGMATKYDALLARV